VRLAHVPQAGTIFSNARTGFSDKDTPQSTIRSHCAVICALSLRAAAILFPSSGRELSAISIERLHLRSTGDH
jgi:hypothetical protein